MSIKYLQKQTDLTTRYDIQMIKNKHDSGANVVSLFPCVTHSLVERLTDCVTR